MLLFSFLFRLEGFRVSGSIPGGLTRIPSSVPPGILSPAPAAAATAARARLPQSRALCQSLPSSRRPPAYPRLGYLRASIVTVVAHAALLSPSPRAWSPPGPTLSEPLGGGRPRPGRRRTRPGVTRTVTPDSRTRTRPALTVGRARHRGPGSGSSLAVAAAAAQCRGAEAAASAASGGRCCLAGQGGRARPR
jgi:hypothetical protein